MTEDIKRQMKNMKYRPMFDKIITTANREKATASGLILADTIGRTGRLNTTQTVLVAGENCPEYIKPGAQVELDMKTFPKKMVKQAPNDVGADTYEIEPPLYENDEGVEFMLMSIRNLLYVIED